jgi:hypothetical protein
MQLCDSLSLQELQAFIPLRDQRRRLAVNGVATNVVVQGDELTRQYRCGEHYLLITNYDHFEAVTHWFYLLGSDGRIVDQASTPDYFGFLEHESVETPRELAFGFYGTNDRWRLRVLDEGQWSFSWRSVRVRPTSFFCRRRFMSFERSVGAPWHSK